MVYNIQPLQRLLIVCALFMAFGNLKAQELQSTPNITSTDPAGYSITGAKKINPTTVEVSFSNNQKMLFDFYGENIFRLFQDNSGEGMRDPEATPEAQILVNNLRKNFQAYP